MLLSWLFKPVMMHADAGGGGGGAPAPAASTPVEAPRSPLAGKGAEAFVTAEEFKKEQEEKSKTQEAKSDKPHRGVEEIDPELRKANEKKAAAKKKRAAAKSEASDDTPEPKQDLKAKSEESEDTEDKPSKSALQELYEKEAKQDWRRSDDVDDDDDEDDEDEASLGEADDEDEPDKGKGKANKRIRGLVKSLNEARDNGRKLEQAVLQMRQREAEIGNVFTEMQGKMATLEKDNAVLQERMSSQRSQATQDGEPDYVGQFSDQVVNRAKEEVRNSEVAPLMQKIEQLEQKFAAAEQKVKQQEQAVQRKEGARQSTMTAVQHVNDVVFPELKGKIPEKLELASSMALMGLIDGTKGAIKTGEAASLIRRLVIEGSYLIDQELGKQRTERKKKQKDAVTIPGGGHSADGEPHSRVSLEDYQDGMTPIKRDLKRGRFG